MNLLNEHISDNLLNRYRAGKLSLAELLQFDAHLQVCDACQNHLAKNKQVAESFAALKIDLSETMAQPSAHLSYEELAVALGIPVGTVKWRLFNAKKKLAPIINATSPRGTKRTIE